MDDNKMDDYLHWTYRFEEQTIKKNFHLVEIYETVFCHKPVVLEIYPDLRVCSPPYFDELKLRIYSHNNPNTFIGLSTIVGPFGIIKFMKNTDNGGPQSLSREETPTIESFIEMYKPIFLSQRDLKKTFERYLNISGN